MSRVVALAVLLTALLAGPAHAAGLDLSTYTRVGRFDLPNPQASEASAVTYDWDTDTLFVVGDEGTAVAQVSKTGQLINTMTLAAGAFDDTEGIAYIGDGKFVLSEERERRVNLFTYAAGGTLTRAAVQSVKVGTTIGNVGIEGLTYDRTNGTFVLVKEKDPEGIFQTGIDWVAGTATNGSATTENSVNLFNPTLLGLPDLSDVYAVDADQLLVLSQEAGRIVAVNRAGMVSSALTITGDAGNPLSVPDQGHEGVAVDGAGRLYVASEGGGGANQPQLWVYAPSTGVNAAPTAVTLNPGSGSIAADASTATRVKVADVTVADDGLGTNGLAVTGPDAGSFEVDASGLYLKAGTALNRASFTVSVTVDDTSVGATPDATSAPFTLTVTAAPAGLAVTEVSSWSSGDSPYGADWFEVTNKGATAVDVTGWKVDDSSNAFASAIALNGVSSIAPGESVIFLEGDAAKVAAFKAFWSPPAGVQVGTYSGSGIGLSTDGDAVNLFNAAGVRVTGVTFGAATTFVTFDTNAGGLSVAGRGGAYAVGGATGSPGAIAPALRVTEVAPWASGNSPYGADWFEVTNVGPGAADLTGFKVDDSSNAFASAIALNGVSSIAPGRSVIFIEGDTAKADAFKTAWFGGAVPTGFQIGTYSGSGIGLSTDGDAVNLFDAAGNRVTGVTFGASTTYFSFDNAAGASGAISALSVVGRNGAFKAGDATGSPGSIATRTDQVTAGGGVNGLVPAQLGLVLGAPATFAPFIAGVAKDYLAATTATVTSTAGDAALSVSDASAVAPGHLVNGTFALPAALQINANGGAYGAVSGTLLALLTYAGPVSNDEVAIGLKQPIGTKDALRTGGYAKTLTFTLSTTTP
ncbi:SdiA-regulated domain-containing protein [Solirubrobacter soli]|uniref:SdiA-regulated domain-containing protein n=1 Tax=Solirubrobacter soli TaxID=363832 RepID=UPI0003F71A63|nr:SdiA-regulated domain-containing protein [Solirubrobacter soli]